MISTRRHAIAASAAFALSTRGAFAQNLTSIRVASNPINDVVPLLYAQSAGLFRNAGLDVSLEKATNGSAVAAALAGNAIDIGKVSSTAIITAHARGVPLTIIFPDRLHTAGADSETQIVVPPDSPIRTGRDLNGKTLSVGAIKDSTWIGARLFVDARKAMEIVGDDIFQFGLEGNRVTLEAFLDYTYEQGVCSRRLVLEELFAPQTLVHAQV